MKFFYLFICTFVSPCWFYLKAQSIFNYGKVSYLVTPLNLIDNAPAKRGDLMFKINSIIGSKAKFQTNIAYSPIKHLAFNANAHFSSSISSFTLSTGYYNAHASKKDSSKTIINSINIGFNYCPKIRTNDFAFNSFKGTYNRYLLQFNSQIVKSQFRYLFGIVGNLYDWRKISIEIDRNDDLLNNIISNDPFMTIDLLSKWGIHYDNFAMEFGLNWMLISPDHDLNYQKYTVTAGFLMELGR